MSYNPTTHHRRSIRLKGYDYSQAGLYLVTICCQNRVCHFGKIENGGMILNNIGKISQQCWLEIPKHFPDAKLHEYVVMPNHIHGIIELVGAKNFSPLRPHGTSRTIGSIIRGFKIGVTKQLGVSIWQRNYYEHVIRNERSHQNISNYVVNNPAKWQNDKFYEDVFGRNEKFFAPTCRIK
ncbi:MAG: transposase [Prevotellaceae bacterium]|jgi:REP element-mobilizing transposase RayT|nr:transposase [Prevotellaceae bacterium]